MRNGERERKRERENVKDNINGNLDISMNGLVVSFSTENQQIFPSKAIKVQQL